MHCSSNSLLVNELRAGTQVNSCVTPIWRPIREAWPMRRANLTVAR
jgi:hypothetical protein